MAIVKAGGAVAAITLEAANVVTELPDLADGSRPRYIHLSVVGTTLSYWRTGPVGDVMSAAAEGTPLARATGDKFIQVPPGHTHIHIFGTGADTAICTPLHGKPMPV